MLDAGLTVIEFLEADHRGQGEKATKLARALEEWNRVFDLPTHYMTRNGQVYLGERDELFDLIDKYV